MALTNMDETGAPPALSSAMKAVDEEDRKKGKSNGAPAVKQTEKTIATSEEPQGKKYLWLEAIQLQAKC